MAAARTSWCLSALAVCVSCLDARADEFRDAKHHYSVTLPKGWMAGNERMVDIVNRDQKKRSPTQTPCVGYCYRAVRLWACCFSGCLRTEEGLLQPDRQSATCTIPPHYNF